MHGYDLLDAVFLDALKFVSIADEKVIRVFEAPQNFVQLAKTLGVADFTENEVSSRDNFAVFPYIYIDQGEPPGRCECSSPGVVK